MHALMLVYMYVDISVYTYVDVPRVCMYVCAFVRESYDASLFVNAYIYQYLHAISMYCMYLRVHVCRLQAHACMYAWMS